MSVAWPSVVTNVNTPALSIVKTTRPECKVVDGPEGMSLGNRMITELPKSSIRNDPSELGKMRCSLPFDLVDSVEPVLRLVNDKRRSRASGLDANYVAVLIDKR